MSNGDCAISSMQVDMRIYTAAEAKTPYFKRDYSLCDFVVQAQSRASTRKRVVEAFSFLFLFLANKLGYEHL